MESHPCRTRTLVTPSSCGAAGAAAWWPLGAPGWPLGADCFVPHSRSSGGKSCGCFCLERARGAPLLLLLDVGFLGTRSPSVPWEEFGVPPSAFLAHGGCLIYCSLLGNGEGGEAGHSRAGAWVLLSSPSQKKCLPPFAPSLAPWAVGDSPRRLAGPWVA